MSGGPAGFYTPCEGFCISKYSADAVEISDIYPYKGGLTVTKRALISVSDKSGLVEFAQGLEKLGYEIVSTGGTFKALQDAGIKVTPVAEVTGFRRYWRTVKTLHPKYTGYTGDEKQPPSGRAGTEPNQTYRYCGRNLYPFKATVSKPG